MEFLPALVHGAKDKHSFIHLNSAGEIDECREKIVLSENALVGVHYFRTARHFKDAYEYMVRQNLRAPNGEFYLSLCYQSMIENKHTVGYCELDKSEHFYPVGEPGDYFDYLYAHGGYTHDVDQNNTILYKDDNLCVEYCKTGTGGSLLVDGQTITDEENATMNNCFRITMDKYTRQNKKWFLNEFVRGWFIGNFEPSIVKTEKYEVALLTHNKDEKWDFHYHQLADETNFLLEGRMLINERLVEKGSLFIIQKNQLTCPIFLENCKILCIKVPSVPSDKYGV